MNLGVCESEEHEYRVGVDVNEAVVLSKTLFELYCNRLNTSSLSLGVLVPRVTQCMR
jgi:hypothetical protein